MMSPVSNHVTLVSASSSARASFPNQNDRERSRNAKAQARHRAKRKAYVEQLEATVTRLQSALALNSDDMASIPSPLHRIRELEEENSRLHQDVADLRRELEYKSAQILRPDLGRRTSAADVNCDYDERGWDLDYNSNKKARYETDRDFMLRPAGNSARSNNQPPPPLHIPSAPQHHYNPPPGNPRQMFQNGGLAYQVASPLSTSSATSSPSFSPHHLSPIHSRSSGGQHHSLPSLNNQYPVKVEDECYLPTPTLTHSHTYSYTHNEPVSVGTNPWHAYPSERDIQQ